VPNGPLDAEGGTMVDPASLLGGVATNLLYDLLKLGVFSLHDHLAGPPEVCALRAAYREALDQEADPDIIAFLAAEGVAGRLLPHAIIGGQPDDERLGALFARTLPKASLPASFVAATGRFCRNLIAQIGQRAGSAESPLANLVQQAQMLRLREDQGELAADVRAHSARTDRQLGDLRALVEGLTTDRGRQRHALELSADLSAALHHATTILTDTAGDFVGREWFFAAIAEFFDRHDRGYLRLTADAGLGKTALAAEAARRYGGIAYFFSAPMGLTSAALCRRALCAALIDRFRLPDDGVPPEGGEFGALLAQLLAQSSAAWAEGAPLLVVVDGLDEMAPTAFGGNVLLLPDRLPAGVYLLLTARPGDYPLATAPDTRVLGLTIQHDDADQQADVRSFLLQQAERGPFPRLRAASEPPLDAEGFAASLSTASEGNFMYLHYVLADLVERDSGLRIEGLPRGLDEYYGRMWSRLKAHLDFDWLLWDRLQRPTLALLAVVGEPVGLDWLAAHTGQRPDELRERALRVWRRFLRADGPAGQRRWHVIHQSFADFLATREELDLPANHRAVAGFYLGPPSRWGDHDGYAYRHLARHLRLGDDSGELFRLVDDRAWSAAQERHDPSGVALLGDLGQAWRAAEHRDAAALNQGTPPPLLAREFTAALATASLHSLAERVPPELLTALVRAGQWTIDQAIAAARLHATPPGRARALVGLIPVAPEAGRDGLVREALAAAATVPRRSRAAVLIDLLIGLAPAYRPPFISATRELADHGDTGERSETLARLAPLVPAEDQPPLLDGAIGGLRTIVGDDTLRDILLKIVPLLDATQLRRLRAEVAPWDSVRRRADGLAALVPSLRGEDRARTVGAAFALALGIENPHERARPLTTLIPCLDEAQLRAVRDLAPLKPDTHWRLWPFAAALLCRQAAMGDPDGALATAVRFRDPTLTTWTLEMLAEHFGTAGMGDRALDATRRISDAVRRAGTLIKLLELPLPDMAPRIIAEVLMLMRSARGAHGRAAIAARLAPHLASAQLAEVIALVRAIGDAYAWGRALVDSLQVSDEQDQEQLLEMALSVVSNLPDDGDRATVLAVLCPHLLAEQQSGAYALIATLDDPTDQARALAGLVPFVPEATDRLRAHIENWLGMLAAEPDADTRYHTLARELRDIPPSLLDDTLAKAHTLVTPQAMDALRSIAAEWLVRAGLGVSALALARCIEDRADQSVALARLSGGLPAADRDAIVAEVLESLAPADGEERWVHGIEFLLPSLQAVQIAFLARAARGLGDPALRAHLLAAILPRLPRRQRRALGREALRACRLSEPWDRARLVVALAPGLPYSLWSTMIDLAGVDGDLRVEMDTLAALAPRAPARLIRSWLNYARDLPPDTPGRACLFASIAIRLPESARHAALEEAHASAIGTDDGDWATEALDILAPHLPIALLQSTLARSLRIRQSGPRSRILVAIAPAVLALPNAERYAAWQTLLHGLALGERHEFLGGLSAFRPLAAGLGDTDTARALAEGLLEVVSRWP
jgi:hypothetical protein